MQSHFWLNFIGVAAAMAAVDWCWAWYISAIADTKAVASASWSAVIVLLSAFVVVGYVDDKRLLIAAGIGAWIGTYLSVKYRETK